MELRIWDFETWNLKFGIWNLKLGIENLKFGIENLRFGIENLKLEIENLTFGIESLMLRHSHCVVVCSCWKLGHCKVGHVVIFALGHFFLLYFFLAWCNLNNVGGSWILAILVICDVIEWILGALKLWKIYCIGLDEYIYDTCGKFYFMNMAKYCGYGYGKILWVWKIFLWIWKNFVGPWYGKKFVDMGMDKNLCWHEILVIGNFCWAWDFLWLSWWCLTLVFVDFSGELNGNGWFH